jgi:carboxylesterase type B
MSLFVFGTLSAYGLADLRSPDSDGVEQVSAAMRAAWVSSGRDHRPVISGVPWDPYEPDIRTVMVIDRQCWV